ncbi:MAG TPA: hexose kinase [Micromonospora sp.]|nr:hexose kinase [Micromonospora sp.]
MILTVTANPALDVTYELDHLRRGQVHRVAAVSERPGGKGINVGRVLHQLGEQVTVTGLSGGPSGAILRAALERAGVVSDLLDLLPDVRRTLVVHEDEGVTTSLWEPGRAPVDPPAAADSLVRHVDALLAEADALVVSGSLPPGIEPMLPARLAAVASAAKVPVIVDADGAALQAVAAEGGAVLMPNVDELARLVEHSPSSRDEALQAARELLPPVGRVPAVVLTFGEEGMAVVRPERTLLARPPERIRGNPTGAGDAACAAVARKLAAARSLDAVDWRDLLADAVALSAAAVLRPVAGEVDLAAYRRWRHDVIVEEA